ncbi:MULTISPECIES: hypothetical protein [Virgibacillus]|uniref:DUF3278 domain-containing protein n=1 Tax=Virgibacillus dokdonensis TaxID=302167 RepID=A0A2K9J8A6_9BACI|nr:MULTISPECIES: hypothetical protein [Virgibacillus]AUJ25920.1 hypothetical protein A21D_02875 [Virgibacillus dokdonensis]NWO13328.1 hypothetical protein [Virgibacillus sp.]
MKRSFIHVFLPEDEYKQMRIVTILAEVAVIVSALLMLCLFAGSWFNWHMGGYLTAFFIFGFILFYTYVRYILSGMEYAEIAGEINYNKAKRKVYSQSIRFGIIFSIVMFVTRGIPNNWIGVLDIIGPSILATIFYFIFDRLSLKKSYKKNKDLLD